MTRELVIVSGKGGTGKTSMAAAYASLADNALLVDCDVDASDMHIICQPEIIARNDFFSLKKAEINTSVCTACGTCRSLCRFDAVDSSFTFDNISCEGCGVCAAFCPASAITMKDNLAGEWYVSDTRFGTLVHARLGIAEDNSGKLVATVKNAARQRAKADGRSLILCDGPPGIGCPVIASVSGADLALIVCEPTVSGYNDMQRLHELLVHFRIREAVCINKFDVVPEMTATIEAFCSNRDIPVIGKIPFSKVFNQAQMMEKTVIEYGDSAAGDSIRQSWSSIISLLEGL